MPTGLLPCAPGDFEQVLEGHLPLPITVWAGSSPLLQVNGRFHGRKQE